MENKLSPTAQEIKRKQRAALRAEYWKQITNPHAHGTGESGYLVRMYNLVPCGS